MGYYFEIILTTLFLSLFYLIRKIYLGFKSSYTHWSRKNVQFIEPTFPLGNINDFIFQRKSIGIVFLDFYNEFKSRKAPFGGFFSFASPHFMPLDPELIKTILTKDFAHFHDRDHYVDEENDPLTIHMPALRGQKWKQIRTKLTPAFTSSKLKMMYKFFVQCSDQLTKVVNKSVQQNELINIKDISGRYTTDIIGNCAFGIDCNTLANPDTELNKYGQKLFEVFYRLFFIRMLAATDVGIIKLFNLKQFGNDITNFFVNFVQGIVENRENNKVNRDDMMSLLIKLKNNESIEDNSEKIQEKSSSEGITMKDVVAQTFIFFFAGYETSASTMTLCLFELAYNADIQDKLRAEILANVKQNNNQLTYESVMEMPYLDKVIKETLRKYPISPNLNRKCVKSFRIPNTDIVIEKNVSVIIPVLGLHRDPDYYPDPEKFDPERFSEEQKNSRHPYVYLPFGEGPRICIGMRFGLLQTKVGVAELIRNFKFTLDSKIKYPLEFDKKSFTLSSRDTIMLQGTKL